MSVEKKICKYVLYWFKLKDIKLTKTNKFQIKTNKIIYKSDF